MEYEEKYDQEHDKSFKKLIEEQAALTQSFIDYQNALLEAKLAAMPAPPSITAAPPGLTNKCAEIILPPTAASTVITTDSFKVIDSSGNTRVRFGVWDDAAEQIPAYNESTAKEGFMEFTNPNVLLERLLRDKAIIAMHVLRVTKPKDSKGVGPNREDHPLFREVVHMWLNGETVTGEKLEKVEQARQRVTKYGRQLAGSRYYEVVTDSTVPRGYAMQFVNDAYKQQAEAELAEAIKGETYGGW